MKKIFKNKKIIFGIITIIVVVCLLGIFLYKNKNTNNKKELKKETYTLYVSINPLVKLVFEETYFECTNDYGEKEICSSIENKVTESELINDDAKEIYKNLDFTNKTYLESIIMIMDKARENNIAFSEINLITDYKNIDYNEIKNKIKENPDYTNNFNVFIDIKEYINEEEVLEKIKTDTKTYSVTFEDDGNKIEERIVKENTILGKLETPKKEGYKFIEWQLKGKKFDPSTKITENITLTAKWKKINNNEDIQKEEEIITKTITIKNPKITAINVYEDNKIITSHHFYNYNKNVKITVKGNKSQVDKINNTNVKLGVDTNYKKEEEHRVRGEIIVTNKLEVVNYKIESPEIYYSITVNKKVSSTIDKINLNDNLLVIEWYKIPSLCGNVYITTNFNEVFKNYLNKKDTKYLSIISDEHYDNSEGTISESKFDELSSKLTRDKSIEKRIVEKLEKIKSSKQRNVANFEYNYSEENGTISYKYNYLVILDENIYKLPEEFNSETEAEKLLKDPNINITQGMCGDMYGDVGIILDEKLCNKYNLTCDRW